MKGIKMKKILFTIILLVLSIQLNAAPVSYSETHESKASDMKEMADGMGLIMNGLLYNYLDNVNMGVKKIQGGVKRIQSHDLKQYLPADTAYAHKFGEKSLRRIMEYSKDVEESMKAKDYEAAFDSSTLLMRQCNSCHSRVRGW